MTYAEKVWTDIVVEHRQEQQIAIISAALKRQREECAKAGCGAWVHGKRGTNWPPIDKAILNAAIDAPTDSEVKHGS